MPAAVGNRLIVALDVPEPAQAERLATQLQGLTGLLKIGSQLFTVAGPAIIDAIHRNGGRVFLDLKFHDIPSVVGSAARGAARRGVTMFTVHASGGRAMMQAALDGAADGAAKAGVPRPLVVGVTVLTSLDDARWGQALGIQRSAREQVLYLAAQAQEAGLDGVVASPEEIADIRRACGGALRIVTPGVRPAWAPADDQRRVLTPRQAIAAGADYIVVGRPILRAPDPAEAARRILAELQEVSRPGD